MRLDFDLDQNPTPHVTDSPLTQHKITSYIKVGLQTHSRLIRKDSRPEDSSPRCSKEVE